MVAVGYFDGCLRRGLLVWTQSEQGSQALGGIAPEDQGYTESSALDPQTVVTTDTSERVIPGWVHPDTIDEIRS